MVNRFGSTTALKRIDGPLTVTGAARYTCEYPVAGVTYVAAVQSTIARGRIVSLEASAARALPGVLALLWHENVPRLGPLDGKDLAVFQSDAIASCGQFVAAVVAETLETARQAANMVTVRYEEQPHDVDLRVDRSDLYKPEYVRQKAAAFYAAERPGQRRGSAGDCASLTRSHLHDPAENHNPFEPHSTLPIWSDDGNGEHEPAWDASGHDR